jgi:hypothetical protein
VEYRFSSTQKPRMATKQIKAKRSLALTDVP